MRRCLLEEVANVFIESSSMVQKESKAEYVE